MAAERGVVLVVEDDPASAEMIAEVVGREGFTPIVCTSAAAARHVFETARPVSALVDWNLPDAPGSVVCRELRAADPLLTIIFVSGRADETSAARGLDAGADDFVVKPVREGELMARLEAHLRRVKTLEAFFTRHSGSTQPRGDVLRFGAVELDLPARSVTVSHRPVKLGPLEYRLFEYLALNAGVALSRDQILAEVYGISADIDTDRVDLLVRRLRMKLGEYPDAGGHIRAQPGYGYLLERQASAH